MTVTIFLIRFRAADYVIAKNSAGEYKEFNHPIFQVCQSLIIYDARLPLFVKMYRSRMLSGFFSPLISSLKKEVKYLTN